MNALLLLIRNKMCVDLVNRIFVIGQTAAFYIKNKTAPQKKYCKTFVQMKY